LDDIHKITEKNTTATDIDIIRHHDGVCPLSLNYIELEDSSMEGFN